MSYIVFARKYRPQTFDEIVGQPHITTTLKNAIDQGRVAHAYLFSGPRGVGKTTTARILAKALNCEKGPRVDPCNTCPVCEEITKGSSLDVLEIDGASNRGIEEIRNLRENVKFSPSKGRFKVYIIDEVHMLTPEAFNALLKTLEEPPPHVKFIFATTQVYKVPATILSRCQRFDFRRISTKDIAGNLKDIVKKEKLSIDDEAVLLVAKHADGSMRDGQVVLDQIISFAQGPVGESDVEKVLGIVDEEILFSLASFLKEKDAKGALTLIARVVEEGKETSQVVLGLIEHFRNLSVIKAGDDLAPLIEAGPDRIKRYKEQAGLFTAEELLYIAYALSNALDLMRKTGLGRIPLEVAVIRLVKRDAAVSLSELVGRLEALESRSTVQCGAKRSLPEGDGPRSTLPELQTPIPDTRSRAEPSQREGEASPKGTSPDSPSTVPNNSAGLDGIIKNWPAVLDHIRAKKISVASYLEEGSLTGLDGHKLSISFPGELQFHKEMLESPDARALIEKSIKELLDTEIRIFFTLEPALQSAQDISPARPAQSNGAQGGFAIDPDAAGARPESIDPIIKNALDIFDGEIPKRDIYNNKGKAR